MSMLFASKNSWIFWVTRNRFRVPKNKRKRDPNYSSICLGTVEKCRFTLTKCTAFTTCVPYVYQIFMVCCHFLETMARAFFSFVCLLVHVNKHGSDFLWIIHAFDCIKYIWLWIHTRASRRYLSLGCFSRCNCLYGYKQ